jgi:hypothetical protein
MMDAAANRSGTAESTAVSPLEKTSAPPGGAERSLLYASFTFFRKGNLATVKQ